MDLAHEFDCSHRNSHLIYVSILVLMDLAHESAGAAVVVREAKSFNPCFNGSCSRIGNPLPRCRRLSAVSILVLMDLAHE